MRRRMAEMLMICATTLASSAQALEAIDPRTAKIEGIVSLPVKGIKAVQSDGKIRFLSENGRFVITGKIYDLWYKKTLNTLAEMEDVSARIDIKKMGLDVNSLNMVSMGQGKKEVIAFIDPRCTHSRTLIKDATKLTRDYTFKFIVVPALGEKSNSLAKSMSCAKDRAHVLNALMSDTLSSLPTLEQCDSKRYDLTLLTAQLMEIEGVPFVISPDGLVSRGRPSNLKAWLKGGAWK